MERVLSEEERLRRAIEISERRNVNYYSKNATRVNVNNNPKNYKLFKRMIIQITICLLIYFNFYLITTTNYTFSNNVISNVKDVLNYDINIENLYNTCKTYIYSKIGHKELIQKNNIENTNFINLNGEVKEEIIQANNTETNIMSNNVIEENQNLDKKDNTTTEEISKEKPQMELDAEIVKKICEFKKPLSGKITSEYGEREVTSKVMSADHKGIDIAANSGTNIKSAMSGIVSVAEENSEYGKFIKIIDGEVMTVYAHCKKINVKVGDKINIGQTIATVGSTGNSTGPHLHFEIRLSNRYINPRYVIEF